MMQKAVVLAALLGAAAIAAIAVVGIPAQATDACANPTSRAQLRDARRALDAAIYDVQAARSGGSLYAAAKVAAADPAEVERTKALQRQAFERLERARAACAVRWRRRS
jgi:hypothetical protein